MARLHHALHQALPELNGEAAPRVERFEIPPLGVLRDLKAGGHILEYRSTPEQEILVLSWTLHAAGACRLPVAEGTDPAMMLERLRALGISAEVERDGDGPPQIVVDGRIPGRMEISGDLAGDVVNLAFINLERPGMVSHTLRPERIGETLVGELVRFLARSPSRLAGELELAGSDGGADDEDATGTFAGPPTMTQQLDRSRMGTVGHDTPRLSLSYYDIIREVDSGEGEFRIGRGEHADLMVAAPFASRVHARVVYRNGKFVLIDQSTNGTFVKPQGGAEVYLQGEELPLSGSGLISLGKSVSVSSEHLVYYFCH